MQDAHMASMALLRLGARAKKRSTGLWLRIRVASKIKWWLARWLWLFVGVIFFMSSTYVTAGLSERDSKMRCSSHALISDSTHPLDLIPNLIGFGNVPCDTSLWTWERHKPTLWWTIGQRIIRLAVDVLVLLFCCKQMLVAMLLSPETVVNMATR